MTWEIKETESLNEFKKAEAEIKLLWFWVHTENESKKESRIKWGREEKEREWGSYLSDFSSYTGIDPIFCFFLSLFMGDKGFVRVCLCQMERKEMWDGMHIKK